MMLEIRGRVLRGDRVGKQLGYPTANLDRRSLPRGKFKVKFGIYAGLSVLPSGKIYKAGIVIGPLDKKHLPKIEAHLIGFRGNLYGKRLTLRLQKYLRPFRRFSSIERLKRQIKRDIRNIQLMHL